MGKPFSSSVIRSGLTKPRCSPRQFPFRSFCFCFFSPPPPPRSVCCGKPAIPRCGLRFRPKNGSVGRCFILPPLLPPFFHPCLPLPIASPFVSFFPRLKFQIKTIRWSKRSLTPRAQTGKLIQSLRRKTVAMRPGRKIEETETATVCSRGGVGRCETRQLASAGEFAKIRHKATAEATDAAFAWAGRANGKTRASISASLPNAFNGRICGIKIAAILSARRLISFIHRPRI